MSFADFCTLLFHAPGDEVHNENEPIPLFHKEITVIKHIILKIILKPTAKNVSMWIKLLLGAVDGSAA